jgi:hypothetical protein
MTKYEAEKIGLCDICAAWRKKKKKCLSMNRFCGWYAECGEKATKLIRKA